MMKNFRSLIVLLFLMTSATLSAQDSTTLPVISAANLNSLQQIAAVNGAGIVWQVAWSPDGTQLAVVRYIDQQESVEIWDFQNGALLPTPTIVFSPKEVDQIRWLPDGQHLFTSQGENVGYPDTHFYAAVWDTRTGQVSKTLLDETGTPDNCCDPASPSIVGWNSDTTIAAKRQGKHAIRLSNGGTFVFTLPSESSSGVSTEDPRYGSIASADWSPNDHYIALLDADGAPAYKLHIIDAKTLQSVLFAYGEDYWTCDIAWSPDETTLAVASLEGHAFDPSRTNVRFYQIGQVVHYGNEVILSDDSLMIGGHACKSAMAWSPDGQMIAIGSPTAIRFYETSAFNQLYEVSGDEVTALSWHPSGESIASGDGTGTIRLWGVKAS